MSGTGDVVSKDRSARGRARPERLPATREPIGPVRASFNLVLIGGPSGIGKTTLVDALVSGDSNFARPVSYTTRPPRPGERGAEYQHVSEAEFDQLESDGAFLTVDRVYGFSYAMSRSSVAALVAAGRMPIKEIHPSNHGKLKALLPQVASVLLLPLVGDGQPAPVSRGGDRSDTDALYYAALEPEQPPFDIVIRTDSLRSPADLGIELRMKLAALAETRDVDPSTIDRRNRVGYDFMAPEFSDDRRVTTANFHQVSDQPFLDEVRGAGSRIELVLDLASGRGHLLPMLAETCDRVVAVDLSERMLALGNAVEVGCARVCGSAFDLPFPDATFGLVASSLADPFMVAPALAEVRRVLRQRGRFVFTLPAHAASAAVRPQGSAGEVMTTFMHSTGLPARVFSFTYEDESLAALLAASGLVLDRLETRRGEILDRSGHPVSPILLAAARRLDVAFSELPIVQFVVAHRP